MQASAKQEGLHATQQAVAQTKRGGALPSVKRQVSFQQLKMLQHSSRLQKLSQRTPAAALEAQKPQMRRNSLPEILIIGDVNDYNMD